MNKLSITLGGRRYGKTTAAIHALQEENASLRASLLEAQERVRQLEGAVEWACTWLSAQDDDGPNTPTYAMKHIVIDELRRRAGKEMEKDDDYGPETGGDS